MHRRNCVLIVGHRAWNEIYRPDRPETFVETGGNGNAVVAKAPATAAAAAGEYTPHRLPQKGPMKRPPRI